jgi:5-methylcytosine-specific restriction enzyme A
MNRRLYDSVRWRKARIIFLNKNPLCVLCTKIGREEPATIVDHIKEHKGDPVLFWDETNWQGLCATCHSGLKRIEEHHGFNQSAGLDGQPIDGNHPWNRPGVGGPHS